MDNNIENKAPSVSTGDEGKSVSDSILALPIANIARVTGHIVRGETLWASRNRKHIDSVKAAGVDCIIDFRTADFTDKFADICASKGIEYRHFPIDKANQPDEDLLKSLPELFDMLDNRNCYISCQQGMHRTDIALAIYYMFHDITFIPDLRGHKKNGNLRCDDIMRRVNSLYSALTPELKALLEIPDYSDNEFRYRRKTMLDTNRANNLQKIEQQSRQTLIESIENESGGVFEYDEESSCFIQKNKADWHFIFDFIKKHPPLEYGFIVSVPESTQFEITDYDGLEPGQMYAIYEKKTDAVRVYVDTGKTLDQIKASNCHKEEKESKSKEDTEVKDGFKIKTIHLVSNCNKSDTVIVEGLRDREGNWLEELQ